jgi:hypothetical protein
LIIIKTTTTKWDKTKLWDKKERHMTSNNDNTDTGSNSNKMGMPWREDLERN